MLIFGPSGDNPPLLLLLLFLPLLLLSVEMRRDVFSQTFDFGRNSQKKEKQPAEKGRGKKEKMERRGEKRMGENIT